LSIWAVVSLAVLKQFLNHIHQNNLCQSDNKILLAVSGGMDSMVMLNLFKEAAYPIGVAHCNFQLRGEDSNKDEAFVKAECQRNSVPFYSTRFETEEFATEHGLSVQMAARDLRYAWFNEIAEREGYDFIATAHHLNDSLETILLNLTKGTSLRGFSGIPLKNGKIMRPMLFASHDAIKSFAEIHEINWREDLSNSTDDYQRNFLRHQVVPKLKELNPSLEETLQKSLIKVYGSLELMERGKRTVEIQCKKSAEGVHIQKKTLGEFHNTAAVLWELVHQFGFNLEQCQSVVESLYGQPGKKFFAGQHQITIDRDEILLSERVEIWEAVTVSNDSGKFFLGPFSLEVKSIDDPESRFDKGRNEAVLDKEKLTFPLTWRKWRVGDHFYPMGLTHKKKLSDFMIDSKISLPAKDLVTVLESGGEIAWIVGYRIDDRFKITPETRSSVAFQLHAHFK
jgi:tRNA(Ile)-lysidine synthase